MLAALADLPPTAPLAGRTRVIHERTPAASAAQAGSTRFTTSDGQVVTVSLADAYAGDTAAARSFVDFLESLPHGPELGGLSVHIAPPDEVRRRCGGDADVLACYTLPAEQMIVPGEPAGDSDGITLSYIVAHEYGHHVAANRDNAPFRAIDYGPKRWASRQLVCLGAIRGRLAPGEEGERHLDNLGESWPRPTHG